MPRKRVAILISGRGSNMTALIEAASDPNYPAEVVLVVSNRPDAAGLARARSSGIETATIDHKAYTTRKEFDRVLNDTIEHRNIDLICLAGFMRLLTTEFVQRWENRILNIHPALLPSFPGLDTHARALAAGVKIHGATVHFVTPKLDAGPIVVQVAVPVRDSDTPETLAERVLAAEHRIYPFGLALVASGKVSVVNGRCRIPGESIPDMALIVPGAHS
jgi:phosphoribosylglycinamide formyltransferase-1